MFRHREAPEFTARESNYIRNGKIHYPEMRYDLEAMASVVKQKVSPISRQLALYTSLYQALAIVDMLGREEPE